MLSCILVDLWSIVILWFLRVMLEIIAKLRKCINFVFLSIAFHDHHGHQHGRYYLDDILVWYWMLNSGLILDDILVWYWINIILMIFWLDDIIKVLEPSPQVVPPPSPWSSPWEYWLQLLKRKVDFIQRIIHQKNWFRSQTLKK